MNRLHPVAAALLLASMLAGPLFVGFAPTATALGCPCVVLGVTPTITQLAGYTEVQVAVSNPLAYSVVGLVHVVVHDRDRQTVASSAGIFDIAPYANGTATILVSGLTLGETYAASFYAVSISGVAISMPGLVSLTP